MLITSPATQLEATLNAPANIQADPELQKLIDLQTALDRLVTVKGYGLKPMNSTLLWAEWHFRKADLALNGGEDCADAFQAACDNLDVNEDGNPTDEVVAADGTTWGRAA